MQWEAVVQLCSASRTSVIDYCEEFRSEQLRARRRQWQSLFPSVGPLWGGWKRCQDRLGSGPSLTASEQLRALLMFLNEIGNSGQRKQSGAPCVEFGPETPGLRSVWKCNALQGVRIWSSHWGSDSGRISMKLTFVPTSHCLRGRRGWEAKGQAG